MKVIKRDGREVSFCPDKIKNAIMSCGVSGGYDTAFEISRDVADECETLGRAVTVEEIQDMVEEKLCTVDASAAKRYIKYRYQRELSRKTTVLDDRVLALIDNENEDVKQENSNKNSVVNSVQRDYMAGELSRHLTETVLLPEDVVEAHNNGLIHFHDADYFAQHAFNCCLVNLEDMLQNGTVISETMIDTPHSFSTACNIATQIIAQVASNQYGGQSISLAHLAPFVDVSRKKIREQVSADVYEAADLYLSEYEAVINALTESRLQEEIRKGVQTIQYQIVTLLTTNGQAPFLTEFMYLSEAKNEQEKEDLALIIEETLKQRIKGVKNQNGTWVTPAFPKLIYVLEEDNIREDSKYYYLTKLAAKCTAKRMVPDYISEKKMKELKDGYCFPVMGCRSALAPWYDENGEAKFYGRFNQGVVTINLPDVALTSVESGRDFYEVLDERLNLCHKALLCRHKRLEGTLSDVAPILWQHGALARLEPGEKIDPLLHGGYSSISLGYAGLWECVKALTGKTLLDPEGKELGLQIMREMNAYCQEWTAEDDIGYSIYGTPLESVTYKFAKCLQNRFGVIEGITDKTYITNSYHIHVTEPVDAFTKLTEEADFQDLSKGGAISYVEVPDMTGNIDAVLAVMKHIYDTNMYAELNTKSDHCDACGFDGQIQVIEDDGKLIWECPQCGNRDQRTLSVARRTCGYIGSQFWNQGRTAEIKERVEHL